MNFKEAYFKITNLGVDRTDGTLQSRQIRSTNFIILLTIIFLSPLVIFNFSNDVPLDRLIETVYLLLNLSLLWFNSKKWYDISRVGLIILTDIVIFLLADFQGRSSGIAINFFISFTIIFLIFSYNEKRKMLFCLLFSLTCFVTLEYFDYEITGINRYKSPEDLRIDYLYNAILIAITTFFVLFYYSWQFYRVEISLQQSLEKSTLSEEITNAVIETNNNLIWIVNKEYKLLKYNNLFQYNYSAGFGIEVYPNYKLIDENADVKSLYRTSWKRNQDKWKANYERAFAGENFIEFDEIEINDNTVFLENSWYHIKISDETSYVAVFSKNITKKVLFDKKLNQNLVEKELLLKEIHHRVKNNMQVIIGLLQLQEIYTNDEKINKVCLEVGNRIKAMSLVHELLYQSDDLSFVDFNNYVSKLVTHTAKGYKTKNLNLEFGFEEHPHFLTVENAIPLGLLVNELLTNSLKYAFVNRTEGRIEVGIREEENYYVFYFNDNGVGLPKTIDLENLSTLGLNLVNQLVAQLNAKLELDSDNGTRFKVFLEKKS